jgi:hypothetical protein
MTLQDDGTEISKAELPQFDSFIRTRHVKFIIERIVRDAIITGNGFAEIAYTRDRKDIGKIVGLDPKTMDFQRQGGRIIVDEENEPIGYWQRLTVSGVYAQGTVIKKDEIRIRGGEYVPSPQRAYRLYPVLFDRDQILHIRFYTLGDGLTGISPLEALFSAAVIRLNVEQAMGEAIFRSGFPIWIGRVGNKDSRSAPTAAMKSLSAELSQIDSKSYFVFPWYITIETINPPELKGTREDLTYFRTQVFRTLGVPEQLETESIYYEKKIQSLQERLAEQLKEQLLTRFALVRGLQTIPDIKFLSVAPAMRLSKARRLAVLGRSRVLNWDLGLENAIRGEEGLPLAPSTQQPLFPPRGSGAGGYYGAGEGGSGDSGDRIFGSDMSLGDDPDDKYLNQLADKLVGKVKDRLEKGN